MMPSAHKPQRGFTLIEVLVSLIVIAVGMLGIAKIQALAYASTGTASMRSLAALEAAGMASAMRANQAYWTLLTVPMTVTTTGATVTATDPILNGDLAALPACQSGVTSVCTNSTLLAAYDLEQWATGLNSILPSSSGTITCTPPATGPVSCTITVTWSERTIAINTQSLGGTLAALPTYTLYVQP
jgi:type IV pilus assembly protein PilV